MKENTGSTRVQHPPTPSAQHDKEGCAGCQRDQSALWARRPRTRKKEKEKGKEERRSQGTYALGSVCETIISDGGGDEGGPQEAR